jgi:hypothetical protein
MAVIEGSSATSWRDRFDDRAGQHAEVSSVDPGGLDESVVAAAGPSLAVFQLGESGTGEHLFAAARRAGADDDYLTCLERFVAEEQEHARLLAVVLVAVGHPLRTSHWTDRIFVLIRRAHSLRTEVLVLMVAEVIALSYYGALRDGIRARDLADVFGRIHADELVHVEFHCQTLPEQLRRFPRPVHRFARMLWTVLVAGATVVVARDHGRLLNEVGVSRRTFVRRVAADRRRVAASLFR